MTGANDDRGVRTLRCRTQATGHLRQVHRFRDLPDRATKTDHASLATDDDEPNALEMLLSAFGSCLAAGIHANALVRHIPIVGLSLDVTGEIDDAVHWGTSRDARPIGFEAISVSVRIESDAPPEALVALIKHAVLWSPVGNTLYNQVHLKVDLA